MIRYYKIPHALILYRVIGADFYFVAEWVEEPLWIPLNIAYLEPLLSRGGRDVTALIVSKWGKIKYKHLIEAKEKSYEVL